MKLRLHVFQYQLPDLESLLKADEPVTVEEHQRMGGAGSAVGEFYVDQGLSVALLSLGLPDRFEAHGKPEAMLERVGLDARGITAAILERLS